MSNTKNSPIAVIGAGSWGTALALVLGRNAVPVRLWGNEPQMMQTLRAERVNSRYLADFAFPPTIEVTSELAEALHDVRDVLLVVPSHAFRSVLINCQPFLNSQARIAWATKGLDPSTHETLEKVVVEIFGQTTPMAVLSGPSFATEVAKALPTAVTLASNNEAFADRLIESFRNEHFRLYRSKDIVGVELCGVVKNVLAIAVGMSDGLAYGANARSALITRGIAELSRLLSVYGGDPNTLMSLAGIGDIILTCTTDLSRNRRFGVAVGRGRSVDQAKKDIGQVVEGFANAQELYYLAQKYNVDMPIVTAVYRVCHQAVSVKEAARELLLRNQDAKWE